VVFTSLARKHFNRFFTMLYLPFLVIIRQEKHKIVYFHV
jgi:hypothetical protein